MRNEGVTILQIVITVIIMLIILAVTIFYGQNVSKEARLAAIYNEIIEIENVVKEMKVLNEVQVIENVLSFNGEVDLQKVDSSSYPKELAGVGSGNYYLMNFTSSRKLENVLDLENVKNNYILDFITGNVYLVGGIDTIDSAGNRVIEYDSDEIVKYYKNTFVK